MTVSKVIAKDKDSSVTIIASIDVILMTFLGNDVTNQK